MILFPFTIGLLSSPADHIGASKENPKNSCGKRQRIWRICRVGSPRYEQAVVRRGIIHLEKRGPHGRAIHQRGDSAGRWDVRRGPHEHWGARTSAAVSLEVADHSNRTGAENMARNRTLPSWQRRELRPQALVRGADGLRRHDEDLL